MKEEVRILERGNWVRSVGLGFVVLRLRIGSRMPMQSVNVGLDSKCYEGLTST